MIPRVTFLSIAAFWVAMNMLLWRSEYGSRGSGIPVPVDLVWRKVLTAPDTSSLTVYQDGQKTKVTISCAEGDIGSVYQGTVAFDVTRTPVSEHRQPRTAIMVNVGTPEMAFRVAMQPQAGVGLARMEFIISEHIGVHPMALLKPKEIASAKARAAIARLVKGYKSPSEFFIERLSEGVGTIAAAFYPKPVIVRLSD